MMLITIDPSNFNTLKIGDIIVYKYCENMTPKEGYPYLVETNPLNGKVNLLNLVAKNETYFTINEPATQMRRFSIATGKEREKIVNEFLFTLR